MPVALLRRTRALEVKKPLVLCVATEKNGEVVHRPNAHLLCHKVTPTTPHFVNGAQTADQFGSRVLSPRREREFCVPTTILLP